MRSKLEEAVNMLQTKQLSFVFISAAGQQQSSQAIGIKPLMQELRVNRHAFQGGVIADKVVGKAAALMSVLGGAKAVYGEIMSEPAVQVLKAHQIYVQYGALVPYIENRQKTGRCPMEETVLEIEDAEEAFLALEETIRQLMK